MKQLNTLSHSIVYQAIKGILTDITPIKLGVIGLLALGILHSLGSLSGSIQFLTFFLFLFLFLVSIYQELTTPFIMVWLLLSQFEIGRGTPLVLAKFIHPGGMIEQFTVWFLITYADAIVFILSFIMLFHVWKHQQHAHNRIDYLMIGLLLWGTVTALYAKDTGGALIGIFALGKGVLTYFVVSRLIKSGARLKAVTISFLSILLFQSFWAGYQFVRGSPTGRFFDLASFKSGLTANSVVEQGMTIFRPSGTLEDPNAFALYVLMLLPIPLYLLLYSKKMLSQLFFLTASLLGIGAVLISSSRTGYVVLTLLVLFIIRSENSKLKPAFSHIVQHSRAAFFLLLFLLITTLSLLPNIILPRLTGLLEGYQAAVITSRINLAKEAIVIIQNHPVLGVGLNGFVPEMAKTNITGVSQGFLAEVHNLYLLLAAELGLPGLLIFLLIVAELMRKLKNVRQPVGTALFYGLCVYLLFGLSIPAFLRGAQFPLLMAMLAVYTVLTNKTSQNDIPTK